MTLYQDKRIGFIETRCYECGRFWAYEEHSPGVTCPYCAARGTSVLSHKLEVAERRIRGFIASRKKKS